MGTSGNPFYGMIYAGEDISIGDSISIADGLVVGNNFSTPLIGGSINYSDFNKSLLYNMGFRNEKDYVRPLIWREASPDS